MLSHEMDTTDDIGGGIKRSKRRTNKNRETKFCLVFDEKNRTEFLTGFRKRKEERRKRGHEQMVAKLKEEKRLAKQKKLEEIRNRRVHERGVPEVDHLLEEIDLPNHTVTVTEVEPLRLDNNGLGVNQQTKSDDTGSNAETHSKRKVSARDRKDSAKSHSKESAKNHSTKSAKIQRMKSKYARGGRHRSAHKRDKSKQVGRSRDAAVKKRHRSGKQRGRGRK